jgi:GrpB-like predicted nucleotidyltransferase (UPF0157 family)
MVAVITIVEYDPTWQETFGWLRSTYASALESTPVLAIEHVGSTAVEGLDAKPVIDIDIVVAPLDVGAATDALCSIGFRPLGEQGIAGRWAFRQPEDIPRTHTYVVEEGCLALRNHLAVRDTLRSEPGLRAEYAQLKRELASSSADMGAYVEGKSTLLRRILERAGLTDDELSVIERANRAD